MLDFLKKNKFEQSVAMLIILTFLFLIFYLVTYSWFGEQKTAETEIITVGQVKVLAQLSPTSNINTISPNTTYTYLSTIKGNAANPNSAPANQVGRAYIRASFTAYIDEVALTDEVVPVINTTESQQDKYWIYDSLEGWYYYVGYISNDNDDTATFTTQIKTNELSNEMQGKKVSVKIIIEAIQREYKAYEAEWENAPQQWITNIEKYNIVN